MGTSSKGNNKNNNGNSPRPKSSDQGIRWFNSLQYQLSIRAIVILILAITGMNAIILLVIKDYLVAAEEKSINQIAQSLVKDVEKITNSTESLTKAIASVSESLPKQESLFKLTIPDIIENSNISPLVAGGGIWPEAYQFDVSKQRRSFFWAKNETGKLHYIDDYNSAEGNGYHHEEWYVPVKQKATKHCYWSESYQDPFSLEAMITCSIAVNNRALEFAGVATIDVKLSELTQIVSTTNKLFKGYAFIVDRNNRFISFPDLLKVTKQETDLTGVHSQELLSVSSFAEMHPSFTPIAQQLESINQQLIKKVSSRHENKLKLLADSLSFNSYQIDESQALLTAALLLKNETEGVIFEEGFKPYSLPFDQQLNEGAIVHTILFPELFWKLVLITPESAFQQKVDNILQPIIGYSLAVVLLAFVLGYWQVGSTIVKPFKKLVAQLAYDSEQPLDESLDNEFGQVASKINQKTKMLLDSNRKMAIAMEKHERSDKLRRVSENRFKAIAKTAPDAIISVDDQGKIVDWNPAASETFGYKRPEIINRKFSRLLMPGEVQKKLSQVIDYMEHKIDSLDISMQQIQVLKSDGTIFTAEFSATSWQTERGKFFSMFMRDITARIEAEYKLRHQALHDPLTGLPNRSLFNDRLSTALEQAKRTSTLVAVMIIDLDNFKIINDTLGHGVGDKLLQAVAKRVISEKRETDTVSRLGGDEFGVIQTNFNEPENAMLFASKIRAAIAQTTNIDDNSFQVGCSIGVTIYPDDSQTSENLLRNADMAMYQAKEEGRNSIRFFVDAMDHEIQRRKQILEDISIALVEDQFEVYFQPLVHLHTDKVIGAEALLRWKHPDKGMISPAEFIPIAEQSNSINDIGNWLVSNVCDKISLLDQAGFEALVIAVNISPAQFKRENVFESMSAIAQQKMISPERIECEITESAVMEDIDRVIKIMHCFRDAGFKLSIDDFGTGYSSLNYLKRFPINKIKIDRSFVADIEIDEDSRSIAKAIINLGHSLNLEVLAEGVETQSQQDWLGEQGCDLMQGYFRAKPMPFSEFVEWLKDNC